MGHRDVPIDDAAEGGAAVVRARQGKGFVAAHIALTAFDSWPEFGELIGARYDGHPWGNAPGTIINEAPDFPATKHFPATFAFPDEFYQPKEFSRDKVARAAAARRRRRCRPTTASTARTATCRWRGRRCTARVVSFYSSFGARRRDLGQPRHRADVLRGDQVGARPDRRRRDAAPAAVDSAVTRTLATFCAAAALVVHTSVVARRFSPRPPDIRRRPKRSPSTCSPGLTSATAISTSRSRTRSRTIERLGWESGLYDTIIRTDSQSITKQPIQFKTGTGIATGEQFLARNLNYFDAIFFFGVREIDLTPEQRADLLSFVRDDGKGFVATHAGATGVLLVAGVRRHARRPLRRAPLGHHRRDRHRRGPEVANHRAPARRRSSSTTSTIS